MVVVEEKLVVALAKLAYDLILARASVAPAHCAGFKGIGRLVLVPVERHCLMVKVGGRRRGGLVGLVVGGLAQT